MSTYPMVNRGAALPARHMGIDIGSTTAKIVVIDSRDRKILHSAYGRHHARLAEAVSEMLSNLPEELTDSPFKVAVCGSAGAPLARQINASFIQEVIASSITVRELYQNTRVAIELGGQDAKIVFFKKNEETDQLMVADMRMNGACAGGTGAFIDQVADLLRIETEEFHNYANRGKVVYDISGRCGVFAKTDIQPLLNQGVSKEDIALSTFHAIAKQTIGGLAQGTDICPKVLFAGGPLTFNPRLITVFKERLSLKDEDIIVPGNPELIVALGAALSIGIMPDVSRPALHVDGMRQALCHISVDSVQNGAQELFFAHPAEKAAYCESRKLIPFTPPQRPPGVPLNVFIGIDAGSTTTKFALLTDDEEVQDLFYASNQGDPLLVLKEALLSMRNKYERKGIKLNVMGVGTTGYGEILVEKALKADYHTVETVAHAEAARKYVPDVSFILDLGGQDMKAIYLKDGIITNIVINEACSAGCGSFLETFASSLEVPVHRIAAMAFGASNPSRLGSRCTVFMNSSIITEQKNGKTKEEILASLVRSIVENIFTKVLRINNFNLLGNKIVVQGGTFKNDAVLRAFEQQIGREVFRPPFPGEMGAIGIALLTKREKERRRNGANPAGTSFIGLNHLDRFQFRKEPGNICPFCANNCNRTIIAFNDGSAFVTGNRCERGEVTGEPSSPDVREQVRAIAKKMNAIPNMVRTINNLVDKDWDHDQICENRKLTIGIPRVLEFWKSLPFWKALFSSLGFRIVVSAKSSVDLFESGLNNVPSDTVCFPAKLAHGHLNDLIANKVDRIFMPIMAQNMKEYDDATAGTACTVVQGYPMLLRQSDRPETKYNTAFDTPIFHWENITLRNRQIEEFFWNIFSVPGKVVRQGILHAEKADQAYRAILAEEGRRTLNSLIEEERFGVVLAGRPYHNDELVNHNLADHFTRMGIPVLTLEGLPGLHHQKVNQTRYETTITFHTRMAAAAMAVAKEPNLELVQIVSFGCGHEAFISDEMNRILRETSRKEMLILKLDEGEARGPLNIRIKSFIETVRMRRLLDKKSGMDSVHRTLKPAFPVKFGRQDRERKTILVPNLSRSFSRLITEVFRYYGYKAEQLPIADTKAMELGKKYTHNDMCFPALVNVGEALAYLKSGKCDSGTFALGLAKNCTGCRASQYATVARKALDDAGFSRIPIITTGKDTKDMHPGFKLGLGFSVRMLWGITLIDALEAFARRIRPYETIPGSANKILESHIQEISSVLPHSRKKALLLFEQCVDAFNRIKVSGEPRKPRVAVVGEILLTFHQSSNHFIEEYLEANGMEVVLPTLHDFFRNGVVADKEKAKRGWVRYPFINSLLSNGTDWLYERILRSVEKRACKFNYYEERGNIYDLAENAKDLVHITYSVGEGWLIPGEIIELAKRGVQAFIIIQPFGCLPNHITGRGMIGAIKERFPRVQIVALDYDPDTSLANIENRLQMLIISVRERNRKDLPETSAGHSRNCMTSLL